MGFLEISIYRNPGPGPAKSQNAFNIRGGVYLGGVIWNHGDWIRLCKVLTWKRGRVSECEHEENQFKDWKWGIGIASSPNVEHNDGT